MAKFPGPYLNETKENDPIMERRPPDTMGIGARPSGMPKNVRSESMGLDHVGTSAGSRK